MPTAIAVTSADLALPATDRQTPAAVVVRPPHAQPLDEALTELGAVLEHHGHLVALYSTACPSDHVRRLHTLRAVLESDRFAIVPIDLPPLGLAVLAHQLRQLSLCDFSPGLLACAARLLAHYVHAGALLGSVARLDRVTTDLRSHLRSWVPGTYFAVLANPEPHLVHLDRHAERAADAGLPPPGFATRLVHARGQLAGDWVGGVLARSWQVQGTYEVPLPAESAAWWGTRKLAEFAAAIPDLSVLYQLVASVRREECRWCGLELIGDRCAFCCAPSAAPTPGAGPGGGRRTNGAARSLPGPDTDTPASSLLRRRGLAPVSPAGVPGPEPGRRAAVRAR
ncbi:hypothetical protein [Streptomyces rimosus]|uniref:hypothetical protein n=1 Tax=Streptomyces rimosus TaxID=1927 RepID=UPI000A5758F8|nr:hypothetical protein [Streptomyces rimosus]